MTLQDGDELTAEAFPAAVADSQSNNGTTTSTTFTTALTGATGAGVAFVAPTSGRVRVHNAARMVNSGANATLCSFTMRTGSAIGSGSVVFSAADERSVIHVGTSVERQGVDYLATGLTPGDPYNVQQEFRTDAGTATYAYRHLIVSPTF